MNVQSSTPTNMKGTPNETHENKVINPCHFCATFVKPLDMCNCHELTQEMV